MAPPSCSDRPTVRTTSGPSPQLYHHSSSHSDPGPLRQDGFGTNHFPAPQGCVDVQAAPLSRSKVNDGKERKSPLFPPLCAARLKPIRQKTKNAVVSAVTLGLLTYPPRRV